MGTISKRDQVWESLQDPEFRKQFIDEHINVGLAFQIRALRVHQNLTQTKLAELLGSRSKQPMVSEWENPNYGTYTLETLKDLANAFDVGLLVRFVPFSKLVSWTVDLTSEVIAPPRFSEEQTELTIDALRTSIKDIPVDANQSRILTTRDVSNSSSDYPYVLTKTEVKSEGLCYAA